MSVRRRVAVIALAAATVSGCETPQSEVGEAVDAALGAGAPLDAGPPQDAYVAPGDDFGAPCASGPECTSGFCVRGPDDALVCTRKCGSGEECPEGWSCERVSNTGVDVTFICVPAPAPCGGADLQVDPSHCGECERQCMFGHAAALCEAGACLRGACADGFHDLNGDDADGCEYACTVTLGGEEACDEIDNDCDDEIDEGFDLDADVENCGACGRRCAPPNATGRCQGGACLVAECAPSFVDADGDVENGCEAGACAPSNDGVEACDRIDNDCDDEVDEDFDLDADPENCGACGERCARPNAVTACDDGACTFSGCLPGFFDRNVDPADGCEVGCEPSNGGVEACDGVDNDCDGEVDEGIDVSADPQNCGACGVRCDRPNGLTDCADGACALRGCLDGFYDRNQDPRDGCEVACQPTHGGVETCDGVDNDCDGSIDEGFDLRGDPSHCGACNHACARPGAVMACRDAVCVMEGCAEGQVDLDGAPENGCEYACRLANGGAELCNDLDEDCDGQVDEGFDLDADPQNCGRCGRICAFDFARATCRDGQCRLDACEDGHHNPDGEPDNGCEYACEITAGGVELCDERDNDCDTEIDEGIDLLTDPDHCGGCDQPCDVPHAEALCAEAACRVGRCDDGFVDVDGDVGDGCECVLSGEEICDGRDNDCDGDVDDGFDLRNDPANCGQCSHACDGAHADSVCQDRACRITACDPGFVDDDGDSDNGCEIECAVNGEGVAGCAAPFPYDGGYDIDPPVSYVCREVIFGNVAFNLDVSAFTFSNVGGTLNVAGAPTLMTQTPAPDDGSFAVAGQIGLPIGLVCAERYTLNGRFDDNDVWSGIFSVQFLGEACGITDCGGGNWPVTGTRRP